MELLQKEGERESLSPSSRGGVGSQVGMSISLFLFLVCAGVAGEWDRGGNGIRGDHIGKGEQAPPAEVPFAPCLCFSLCPCFPGGHPLNPIPFFSDHRSPIHSLPYLPCQEWAVRRADPFPLLLPRVTRVWASASQVAPITRTSVMTRPFSSPRSFLEGLRPRMAASGGKRRQGLGCHFP